MNPIFFPKFPHLSLSFCLPTLFSVWVSDPAHDDAAAEILRLYSVVHIVSFFCAYCLCSCFWPFSAHHISVFPLAFAFLIHLRVEWENVPVHCYFFNSKCDIHHSFKHLLWCIPILGWLCRNNGTLHERAATLAALIAVKKKGICVPWGKC